MEGRPALSEGNAPPCGIQGHSTGSFQSRALKAKQGSAQIQMYQKEI